MKKKKIIILSALSVVLITIIVASVILFVPKKLDNLVPLDNIEKITFVSRHDEPYELNEEQIYEFLDLLITTKYNRRINNIKLANSWEYEITYKDGSLIEIGSAMIKKYNKHGEAISTMQYKLDGGLKSLES